MPAPNQTYLGLDGQRVCINLILSLKQILEAIWKRDSTKIFKNLKK